MLPTPAESCIRRLVYLKDLPYLSVEGCNSHYQLGRSRVQTVRANVQPCAGLRLAPQRAFLRHTVLFAAQVHSIRAWYRRTAPGVRASRACWDAYVALLACAPLQVSYRARPSAGSYAHAWRTATSCSKYWCAQGHPAVHATHPSLLSPRARAPPTPAERTACMCGTYLCRSIYRQSVAQPCSQICARIMSQRIRGTGRNCWDCLQGASCL